jgi:methylated-DNA-[protein]-cysteine S-methyltransferase
MRLRIRDGSIESDIGILAIGRRGILLVAEWMVSDGDPPAFSDSDAAAARLSAAYARYFRGNLQAFARLGMGEGTRFQCRVWGACREIAAGETRTYGWIARELRLGNAHCRAIGNALRVNPLPILVPCHRVVSASGLGGYAGETSGPLADIKCRLIAFESAMRRGA